MFCDNLKRIRLSVGARQDDLAKYLNISKQSVSKWENGQSLPSIDILPKIAEFYNCTINAFFSEYELAIFEKMNANAPSKDDTIELLATILSDGEYLTEKTEDEPFCSTSSIPTEALFLPRVKELIIESKSLSCALIQSKLGIGYALAARIIDALCGLGIIVQNEDSLLYIIDKSKIYLIDAYLN